MSWSALYGYCGCCAKASRSRAGRFGDGEDGVLGDVFAEEFVAYWMSKSRTVCAKSRGHSELVLKKKRY